MGWWETQQDAKIDLAAHRGGPLTTSAKHCKGFIDLVAIAVILEFSMGNETSFMLKPRDGIWPEGAIAKGNPKKSFTLDAETSEYTRAQWAECIRAHISKAARVGQRKTDVVK